MSFRIIIPVAGVAGTIAGAIGISNTTFRSKKAAIEVPHIWVVQPVELVSLSAKCSKDEYSLFGRKNYYKFKMFSSVEGEYSIKLAKNGKVDVDFKAEFKAEAGWDELLRFTTVSTKETDLIVSYNDEETLHVILKDQDARRGAEGEIKFFCDKVAEKISWLNKSENNKQIYFSKMKPSDQDALVSKLNEGNKLRVELGNCDRVTDKKTTSCDLQLKDLSGNRWSAKAYEKAKLTFSK